MVFDYREMKMTTLYIFLAITFITCAHGLTTTETFHNFALVGFTSMDYPQGETHYTGYFNNEMYILQTSTLNSTYMEFQITAATTGWVGLILNPERVALQRGDVLIAGIYGDSGIPYFTDMYGDSTPTLTADTKIESDWILVSGEETTTPPQTKLVFHRRYNTTDPNVGQDYAITKEESPFYLAIMGQIDDPFPVLDNSDAVGSSRVNFVIGGTGNEGNGAYGLVGSLTFTFTLASIAVFKIF